MRNYVSKNIFKSFIYVVVAYAVVSVVLLLAKFGFDWPKFIIYACIGIGYLAAIVALLFIAKIVILFVWLNVWSLTGHKIGRRVNVLTVEQISKCGVKEDVFLNMHATACEVVLYKVPFCKPYVAEVLNATQEDKNED